MTESIRTIQYGLGPIGSAVGRHVVAHPGISLVGGLDIDLDKVGKDLGKVIDLGHPLGVTVGEDLKQVLEHTEADIVLHATSSCFRLFKPQIVEILEAGLDVVSTAEELTFPWLAHPEEAREIDALAKRVGKTVLGTGVNPGFIMDSLPLHLTSICQRVDHIDVTRVINASTRRGPFQVKIGAGLSVEAFRARIHAGRIGHVGLFESMGMVFHTLGKELTHYESFVEPVLAEEPVRTRHVEVPRGQVRGLRQVAIGYATRGLGSAGTSWPHRGDPLSNNGEDEFMRLAFVAVLEGENEGDTIRIAGNPNLEIQLKGTNGDIATIAMVVNAIPRVRAAAPGLVTMPDLPIVTAW
jgi:4-hydroxy-tetrahydrodipicolinate reductase